jgi:hypothetical protein
MTIMTALGLMVRIRDLLIQTHTGGDGDGSSDGDGGMLVPSSEANFLALVALVPVSYVIV